MCNIAPFPEWIGQINIDMSRLVGNHWKVLPKRVRSKTSGSKFESNKHSFEHALRPSLLICLKGQPKDNQPDGAPTLSHVRHAQNGTTAVRSFAGRECLGQ